MSTKLDSKAVHEVVDALPDKQSVGYRCILKSDPLVIYEVQADRTWSRIDASVGIGSSLAVVGVGGAGQNSARFLRAEKFSECLTSFYGEANSMVQFKSVIWGDRIGILRTYDHSSDMVLIKSDGEGDRSQNYALTFTCCAVDSSLNLFIGHADGIIKLNYGEPDSLITTYKTSDSSLPFDKIKLIVANGRELYIVSNETDDFKIAHFTGFQWEDLTDQFKSDTGISELTGASCSDITVDDSGNLLIAMTISGKKLFVYDGVTFTDKSVASGITSIKKLLKVGNVVYTVINDNTLKVWDYSTLEVLLSAYSGNLGLVTDGDEIIVYTDQAVFKAKYGSYNFSEYGASDAFLVSIDEGYRLIDMAAASGKRVYLTDGAHPIVKGEFEEQWVVLK